MKVGFPEHGWRAFGHAERAHDHRVAPICSVCHRTGAKAQHQNRGGDEREWWRALGVFPPTFCAALVAAFAAGERGMDVVRQAARGGFPWPDGA